MDKKQIIGLINPYMSIKEDLTPMAKMMLEFMGGKVIDTFATGDYELFLIDDPLNSGGYQVALQRNGRDFMNPMDQMSPGGTLDSFVDLRKIKHKLMKWISSYTEPIYVSSFDEDKQKQYERLLTKLKIPFTIINLHGKSMIQLKNT